MNIPQSHEELPKTPAEMLALLKRSSAQIEPEYGRISKDAQEVCNQIIAHLLTPAEDRASVWSIRRTSLVDMVPPGNHPSFPIHVRLAEDSGVRVLVGCTFPYADVDATFYARGRMVALVRGEEDERARRVTHADGSLIEEGPFEGRGWKERMIEAGLRMVREHLDPTRS